MELGRRSKTFLVSSGGSSPSFYAILGEINVKISTNIAFNGNGGSIVTPRNE